MEKGSKKCLKKDFAERMRYFMKTEGLTFAYLSAECGIAESKLCQISLGRVNVGIITAGRIIEAFHKTAGEYFAPIENDGKTI